MTINFARLRWVVVLFVAALLLVPARRARADYGDPPEVEAQRLVHLLGYVGADYAGAVENGAVTNQGEYDEQISLLDDGAKIAGRIATATPKGGPNVDIAALVAKVRGLVDKKATAEDVGAATNEAKAAIIGAFRLSEAPSGMPSVERGKALFLQHC